MNSTITEKEIRQTIQPEHIASPKFRQLIIAYEAVFQPPEDERVMEKYINIYGEAVYKVKDNINNDMLTDVYVKGLLALDMASSQFYASPRLAYRNNIVKILTERKN